MVYVKVRETYDLHTIKNKMTVIGIHTPKPDIIKKNYPGLLMQCRAYRPVSCDVRIACASLESLDPLQVGTGEGVVAPEDIFNPILYKAMSNKGMSQLESRINAFNYLGADVDGPSAMVDADTFTNVADEFDIYYGLLSNTHDWKHANPQAGLSMTGLRPLVYELVYNVGDSAGSLASTAPNFAAIGQDGNLVSASPMAIMGKAKEMPFINCTSYSVQGSTKEDPKSASGYQPAGFDNASPYNCETTVPWIMVYCGCIIVPPSKLHELFYRMVVEWTIEFSQLRPIGEITDWYGLGAIGTHTHLQNYSYESAKTAITGTDKTILDNDSCMVAANVGVNKVM